MAKSRYDELHDKFYTNATTKAGTRYERLAAVVLKCLDERGVVIHDLRLRGETGAKHQIDVTIELDGMNRRVLIECKDFDLSGNKVGLEIVRNFWAVMDDTKPDEGIVISCNGFTKDAHIYAKGKGIKLAVLRDFREEDWEGKIRVIEVTLNIFTTTEPIVSLAVDHEDRLKQLQEDFAAAGIDSLGIGKGQPVFLNLADGRVQINEFIETELNRYPKKCPGPVEHRVSLDGCAIQVEDREPIPIVGLILKFDIVHAAHHFEVTSNKVAELLLAGIGDADLIIFDEDLKRFMIDEESGEVLPLQEGR